MLITITINEKAAALDGRDGLDLVWITTRLPKEQAHDLYHDRRAHSKPR